MKFKLLYAHFLLFARSFLSPLGKESKRQTCQEAQHIFALIHTMSASLKVQTSNSCHREVVSTAIIFREINLWIAWLLFTNLRAIRCFILSDAIRSNSVWGFQIFTSYRLIRLSNSCPCSLDNMLRNASFFAQMIQNKYGSSLISTTRLRRLIPISVEEE